MSKLARYPAMLTLHLMQSTSSYYELLEDEMARDRLLISTEQKSLSSVNPRYCRHDPLSYTGKHQQNPAFRLTSATPTSLRSAAIDSSSFGRRWPTPHGHTHTRAVRYRPLLQHINSSAGQQLFTQARRTLRGNRGTSRAVVRALLLKTVPTIRRINNSDPSLVNLSNRALGNLSPFPPPAC